MDILRFDQLMVKHNIPISDRNGILNIARNIGPGMEKHAIRLHMLTRPQPPNDLEKKAWRSLETIKLRPETINETFKLHCQALHAIGLPVRMATELVLRHYRRKIEDMK